MPWRANQWPVDGGRIANVGVGLRCMFRNKLVVFIFAVITGVFGAFVWRKYEEILRINYTLTRYFPEPNNYEKLYSKWLREQSLKLIPVDQEHVSYGVQRTSGIREDEFLYHKVPVLCVIFTKDIKRAKAIKSTWAEHCNKAVFYGTKEDEVVPVSSLPNTDAWPMLCGGLLRAWKSYHGDFEWVLVVDDKTYAIVENLRYLVASLDTTLHHYLGHPIKDSKTDQIYNLGTASIAINSKLLEAFVAHVPDDDACDQFTQSCSNADCVLGKLFQQLGAAPIDTRDNRGRGRFNAFSVRDLLIPKSISVFNHYWSDSVYLSSEGEGCCSDYAITFHDTTSAKMHLFEYTLYHLRPFFSSIAGNQTPTLLSITGQQNSVTGKGSAQESNILHIKTKLPSTDGDFRGKEKGTDERAMEKQKQRKNKEAAATNKKTYAQSRRTVPFASQEIDTGLGSTDATSFVPQPKDDDIAANVISDEVH